MAYRVVSSSLYPFRRENAKFFSQELIEYVLDAYGHTWKPKRSIREKRLRAVAGYVFTTHIGRLIFFVSQKYCGFVVMQCFNKWKSIMAQRPSIRERSLCNEIGKLCITSELEDNLGLFTFMAIMAEYARFAITSNQEELVGSIVDALTFCLTDKIAGGFLATLDRMISVASSFEYPRSCVSPAHDPEKPFLSPLNLLSYQTPRSGFESPLSYTRGIVSDTEYDTPVEELEAAFKAREFRREYFRRKNMMDFAAQTEIHIDHDDYHVQSMAEKTEIVDYVVKVDIKTDETTEDLIIDGDFYIVERYDAYVQTSGNRLEKSVCPNPVTAAKIAIDTNVCPRNLVDLNAVAERLIGIQNALTAENVCLSETFAQKIESNADSSEDVIDRNSSERGETCLNLIVKEQPKVSETKIIEGLHQKRETVEDSEIANLDRQLQSIKFQLDSSKTDEGINVSFSDSQSESLHESSCMIKAEKEQSTEQDESFDSQIESLNASIYKSSDESRKEN